MIRFEQEKPEIFGEEIYHRILESTEDNRLLVLNELLEEFKSNSLFQSQSSELKIRLCLDEALVNALAHGNKYDPNKKFEVVLFINKKDWLVEIRDEGNGFKQENLPDYNDPEFVETSESGRGLLLMSEILDEVIFYGKGNIVHLKHPKGDKRN